MARVPSYSSLGAGPLVVLLHGAGGGFRSFAPQVETLASLGFRAVAWNMPGYGLSPPIEPYGFKGLAESCIALIETLAPEGGAEPVALVGHGLGGMVAQEVALRRPDLVRQLVLVATAAAVAPGDAYSRHAAQGLGWLDEGRDMTAIAEALLPSWSARAPCRPACSWHGTCSRRCMRRRGAARCRRSAASTAARRWATSTCPRCWWRARKTRWPRPPCCRAWPPR